MTFVISIHQEISTANQNAAYKYLYYIVFSFHVISHQTMLSIEINPLSFLMSEFSKLRIGCIEDISLFLLNNSYISSSEADN